MRSIPRMSRGLRREFIRFGRKTGDAATALRLQMIAELAAGRTRNGTARRLSAAVSTVVATASRYLALGVAGLFDQRGSHGRRKVDAAFLKELRELLATVPLDHGWSRPTWTRELLCEEVVRRGHERVAVCTMGRALPQREVGVGVPHPPVIGGSSAKLHRAPATPPAGGILPIWSAPYGRERGAGPERADRSGAGAGLGL